MIIEAAALVRYQVYGNHDRYHRRQISLSADRFSSHTFKLEKLAQFRSGEVVDILLPFSFEKFLDRRRRQQILPLDTMYQHVMNKTSQVLSGIPLCLDPSGPSATGPFPAFSTSQLSRTLLFEYPFDHHLDHALPRRTRSRSLPVVRAAALGDPG